MHDWLVVFIVKATGQRKTVKASKYLETEEEVRKSMAIRYGDYIEIRSIVDIAKQN